MELVQKMRGEVTDYILARLRRIQRLHRIFVALYGRGRYEAPLEVIGRKRHCRYVSFTGQKVSVFKSLQGKGGSLGPCNLASGLLNREVSKKDTAAFGKLSGPTLAA